METVNNKKKYSSKSEYNFDLCDSKIEVEISSQGVERSYEDRAVFCNFNFKSKNLGTKTFTNNNQTCWLKGEDAIQLGEDLIKAGKEALIDNMINHQLIHSYSQMEKFIADGRVKETIITKLDQEVVNYGEGYFLFEISFIWNDNQAPKYQEDFKFQQVIYFPRIKEDFERRVKNYGDNVRFVNYDHKFMDMPMASKNGGIKSK